MIFLIYIEYTCKNCLVYKICNGDVLVRDVKFQKSLFCHYKTPTLPLHVIGKALYRLCNAEVV